MTDVDPLADLGMERAVLALTMGVPALVDDVALEPADFTHQGHAAVWQAMRALASRGEPTVPLAIVAEVAACQPDVRGVTAGWVLDIYGAATSFGGAAGWYADRLRELAERRRVREAGIRITQAAAGGMEDVLGFARRQLEAVETVRAQPEVPVADLVYETLDRIDTGGATGIATGWPDLDEMLNPLAGGQLLLVAARPGVGKSVFGLGLARQFAARGHPSLLVSLEMPRAELMARLFACEARVDLGHILKAQVDDDGWAKLERASERVASWPLWIDDSPTVSIADLRGMIRRRLRDGLRLVVVDYLQLMRTVKAESRQQEVAALSRELKLAAGEFGLPLVVLAQLNRGPEARSDRRPHLSDLRESGALEQDADTVLLLYRDELYNRDTESPGVLEVGVAKQRGGRTGSVDLGFRGYYSRVDSLARVAAPAAGVVGVAS